MLVVFPHPSWRNVDEVAKRSRFTAAWIPLAVAAGVIAALLYLFRGRTALFWSGLSIARVPHASIELIAFDQRGHRLSSLDFFRTWRPTLIVRDHTNGVCLGVQYGLGTPRLAIPAAEPVSIELYGRSPASARFCSALIMAATAIASAPEHIRGSN